MKNVSARLGFVVRRLLVGQYLCFSGLFLKEQGHKWNKPAAAFQDRQCESAIWLHQIGLDNKPPEYKGSTVLFNYFWFPKATCQSCWRSYTAQYFSLWHSYIIPSCALWLRWHPYVTTGLMYTVSRMQWCPWNPAEVLARTCTAMGLVFRSKSSFFAHEWYLERQWLRNAGHLCGQWSISGCLGAVWRVTFL